MAVEEYRDELDQLMLDKGFAIEVSQHGTIYTNSPDDGTTMQCSVEKLIADGTPARRAATILAGNLKHRPLPRA